MRTFHYSKRFFEQFPYENPTRIVHVFQRISERWRLPPRQFWTIKSLTTVSIIVSSWLECCIELEQALLDWETRNV